MGFRLILPGIVGICLLLAVQTLYANEIVSLYTPNGKWVDDYKLVAQKLEYQRVSFGSGYVFDFKGFLGQGYMTLVYALDESRAIRLPISRSNVTPDFTDYGQFNDSLGDISMPGNLDFGSPAGIGIGPQFRSHRPLVSGRSPDIFAQLMNDFVNGGEALADSDLPHAKILMQSSPRFIVVERHDAILVDGKPYTGEQLFDQLIELTGNPKEKPELSGELQRQVDKFLRFAALSWQFKNLGVEFSPKQIGFTGDDWVLLDYADGIKPCVGDCLKGNENAFDELFFHFGTGSPQDLDWLKEMIDRAIAEKRAASVCGRALGG